jgi:hypothetical protein
LIAPKGLAEAIFIQGFANRGPLHAHLAEG